MTASFHGVNPIVIGGGVGRIIMQEIAQQRLAVERPRPRIAVAVITADQLTCEKELSLQIVGMAVLECLHLLDEDLRGFLSLLGLLVGTRANVTLLAVGSHRSEFLGSRQLRFGLLMIAVRIGGLKKSPVAHGAVGIQP